MSSKNGSFSPRVLYSEACRSPRATKSARPCGTVQQKKVCRWIPAGSCGPVVSKRKLILIYRKGKKGKEEGRMERPPRYDNARSLAGLTGNLAKKGERAGERQTKTYNGHNARWSTLEFSHKAPALELARAFEKITSSGCLFAFGYFEDEQPSSMSNSIYCNYKKNRYFFYKNY